MKNNNIYLSIGTNLGDKKQNLKRALLALKKNNIHINKVSSIYKTEPVGVKDQPEFFNIAVDISTEMSPDELLAAVLRIEDEMGRVRTQKWGPRLIDIDILLFNGLVVNKKNLIIPHPYLTGRNFVLIPLIEINKNVRHPVSNELLEKFIPENKDQVEITSFSL